MRQTGLITMAILFASCTPATPERPSGQALYTSFDGQVDELLGQMTLDEKVGQKRADEIEKPGIVFIER